MRWLLRTILNLKYRFFRKQIFRTVESIAKTQLRTFNAVKNKFPNLANEELYFRTLMTRPGYTEEDVRQILEDAVEMTRDKEPVRLHHVVHALVMEELPWEMDPIVRRPIESRFQWDSDGTLNWRTYTSCHAIVSEIIPPDL